MTTKQPKTVWESKSTNPDLKIFLTTKDLSIQPLIDFCKSSTSGAIVSFSGTTRDSFDKKKVTKLSYEAHHSLALKSLTKIGEEALTKFDADKIAIVHKLGDVPILEESIIVVCSTPHRTKGWRCGEWLLEQIKEKVEIWKNEVYDDGQSTWKENENSCVKK